MKKMKKLLAGLMAMTMVFALASCEKKPEDMTYAVEAGSAGEAVALEKGYKVVSVDTQAKALMEAWGDLILMLFLLEILWEN